MGGLSDVHLPRFTEPAACAGQDPELFFPEKGGNGASRAKAVCNGTDGRPPCPARQECLAWAVEHFELGVWGGLAERERRALRNAGARRNGRRLVKGRRVKCPRCDVVVRADSLARHRRTHVREMAS